MDLWADFDNNHQSSPGAAEHRRLRSARHLTERAFLSSLRDWLLQDYVAAYCRSLAATRIFRRCYWIDALGADAKATIVEQPAVIEEQPEVRAGKKRKRGVSTPRIVPPILQPLDLLAQALAQESRPITLYGLVLAAGSSKRKEMRGAQNGSSPTIPAVPNEGGVLSASWLEAARPLLKEIEAYPAIFLLNPLGLTPFTYEDLAALCSRKVPTELCLLISHKQLDLHLLAARRTPTHAAALTSLLRTDRWKTLPSGEEEQEQARTGFLDLFTASLQRYFLLPIQPIAIPIASGRAIVEHAPYTLLFATRRLDSLLNMNDAVCQLQRRVSAESHRGVLGEEWFIAQQSRQRAEAWQQLYQQTRQQGQAQRSRRWPDLRQHMLTNNFGAFTQHDYDAIIRQLLLNKEVRCEWRKTSDESVETRIPGNDDTLFWTQ